MKYVEEGKEGFHYSLLGFPRESVLHIFTHERALRMKRKNSSLNISMERNFFVAEAHLGKTRESPAKVNPLPSKHED
jgi:hypothetical protein